MHSQIINYLFSATFILSVVAFIDVLIKLKNPLIIKLMFLVIVIGIGWNAFATIYTSYHQYNRWLVELPYVLVFIGCLNLFSLIYSHNLKNSILFFTSFLLITQLFFLFYFSWIYPVDLSVQIKDIQQLGGLRKVIKVIYATLSLVIIVDLAIKVTKKYSGENLYFKQVRKWLTGIGVTFGFCIIVHILKTVSTYSQAVITIVKACSHLAALLFIIYRPNFLNYTNLSGSLSNTFNFANTKSLKNSAFIVEFFDKLYFLNTETSISDLAIKLDTNAECLNEYIKDKFDLTFSELVNKHRIEYFVSLISSREFTGHNTLVEAMHFSARL